MEVAVADDDAGLVTRHAPVLVAPLARDLDRGLDRLGTGVHREHELLAAEPAELLAEVPELVVVERAARERQPRELVDHGTDQSRMAMTEVQRGIGGQRVEVAPAVDIGDPHALAALNDHGKWVIVAGAVLTFEREDCLRVAALITHNEPFLAPPDGRGNGGSPQIAGEIPTARAARANRLSVQKCVLGGERRGLTPMSAV